MGGLAYLDETGLHLPDYPAVLAYFENRFRAIYGEDVYIDPDSQDGQMLATFAEALFDAYNLAGSVYNAYSPQTAQAVSLSRAVLINGLRRKTATRSTVTLRIVGAVGSILRGAIVKDILERRWLLPSIVSIPVSGEVFVTATAEEIGDIRAAPGDVCKIATPILGWHSVINPDAATPGSPIETDADLRRRQAISTELPSRTVLDGIAGAVAAIEGVTRCKLYENDTSKIDENGLPPHSICLVVEGGDVAEIAQAISNKKTPGCYTHGDVAVPARDKYGVPITIRFFRPVIVDVRVKIGIRPLPGYLATTGETVRANITAAVNALKVGEDVLLSKLYTPVNAADQSSPRTYDTLYIEVGTGPGQTVPANLEIPYNAAAVCDVDNIEIEVIP